MHPEVPTCTRSADYAYMITTLTISTSTSSLCCCSQIIFQPHVETTTGNQPRERLGEGWGGAREEWSKGWSLHLAGCIPPASAPSITTAGQEQHSAATEGCWSPSHHPHSAQSPTEAGVAANNPSIEIPPAPSAAPRASSTQSQIDPW